MVRDDVLVLDLRILNSENAQSLDCFMGLFSNNT
jgi:hypothetical protein